MKTKVPAGADVRTNTIEKCEMLEKQLDIAVEALEFYEKPFACFHPEMTLLSITRKQLKPW